MKDLKTLTTILNYTFADLELLQQALTHRSVGNKNNERLEFLGDALLDLVISEYLYNELTDDEGQLTRSRSELVKKETLAVLARELSLGDYLSLGLGEQKSGGFDRDSILADAFEAILAAIYLDSDFITCKKVILALYATKLQEIICGASVEKDAKTMLQEFLQNLAEPLPVYTVISVTGEDHAQEFAIECKASWVVTQAKANSRKQAEQIAAQQALLQLTKRK